MNTGGLGRRKIETKKCGENKRKIEKYKNNLNISGGVMIKKTTNGRI